MKYDMQKNKVQMERGIKNLDKKQRGAKYCGGDSAEMYGKYALVVRLEALILGEIFESKIVTKINA